MHANSHPGLVFLDIPSIHPGACNPDVSLEAFWSFSAVTEPAKPCRQHCQRVGTLRLEVAVSCCRRNLPPPPSHLSFVCLLVLPLATADASSGERCCSWELAALKSGTLEEPELGETRLVWTLVLSECHKPNLTRVLHVLLHYKHAFWGLALLEAARRDPQTVLAHSSYSLSLSIRTKFTPRQNKRAKKGPQV